MERLYLRSKWIAAVGPALPSFTLGMVVILDCEPVHDCNGNQTGFDWFACSAIGVLRHQLNWLTALRILGSIYFR